jgi:hypothetical protein
MYIIKVIKWRKVAWTRHVARIRDICAHKLLVECLEGRNHLGDLRICGYVQKFPD